MKRTAVQQQQQELLTVAHLWKMQSTATRFEPIVWNT
jgi:hypothetical protein